VLPTEFFQISRQPSELERTENTKNFCWWVSF